jgi:hypothetical protein
VSVDVKVDKLPDVRIMDPNPGSNSVLKYKYNQDSITGEKILQFVKDYTKGAL